MSARQTVIVVVVLTIVGMTAPAVGASLIDESTVEERATPVAPVSDTVVENETANETSEPAPLGSQITAFMHTSSEGADSTMETGIWVSKFEEANASDKAAMIERRTETLEKRLETHKQRLSKLNTSTGSAMENVEQAGRAAAVTARIDALETTVNQTKTVAEKAGVNTSKLDRLRNNASDLNGQAVAKIARGLNVVQRAGPPDDVPGGPPENKTQGPPENKTQGPPENKTEGPPENKTEDPPENRTGGPPGEGSGGTDGDSPSNGTAGASDGSDDTTDGPTGPTARTPGIRQSNPLTALDSQRRISTDDVAVVVRSPQYGVF